MGALNVRAINKLSITIPESNLLQNFDNITSEIRNNLWNIFDKNNILNQTRDRLLSRLMSGKIDLEKLNIQFPPSMEEE
jgi:type I restriction enzyme S subunit